jgi:hypothetical protein
MQTLPLNLLTLYADLRQSVLSEKRAPASISRRMENGKRRLYASIKEGASRRQVYIGTEGDPRAEAEAAACRRAAEAARLRRKTVSVLKRAGVPAPEAYAGRVLETLAGAGLFESGVVLVGTLAFQLYAPIIGARLSSSALITNDADLAIARLAAPRLAPPLDLGGVLRRADPSFEPEFQAEDRLPKEFRSARGFSIDVVTTKGRSGRPLQIRSLGSAATPLSYLDYLIEDPIDVVALYGAGFRVRAPDPARYAVHKLIVAQERRRGDPKSIKDLTQARELIAALDARDPDVIGDAAEAAMSRGPRWRSRVEKELPRARATLIDPPRQSRNTRR